MKRIEPEKRNRVIAFLRTPEAQGLTTAEVGQRCKVAIGTVSAASKVVPSWFGVYRHKPVHEGTKQQWVQRLIQIGGDEHLTVRQIAEVFKISQRTVILAYQRMGLAKRMPPRSPTVSELRVARLWLGGKNFDEIGEAIGATRQAAHISFKRYCHKMGVRPSTLNCFVPKEEA